VVCYPATKTLGSLLYESSETIESRYYGF